MIFGEGNHDEHWRLRSLQKGFARIAITAEEKNNWSLGVKIIPIGLQYDSHSKFRSRILVSFGEAISVKDNVQTKSSLPEQLEVLLEVTSNAIKSLILHIEQPNYESKQNYFLQNRIIKKDLIEQLKADQEIISNTPDEVDAKKITGSNSPSWNPLFLYETINHILPRTLIRWILKTKVKDRQFIGSLKFVLGMVLVPIFYLLQTGVCLAISDSWAISGIYLLSLPVSVTLRD